MLNLSSAKRNDCFKLINGEVYQIDYSFDNIMRWTKLMSSKVDNDTKQIQSAYMLIGTTEGMQPEDYQRLIVQVNGAISKKSYNQTDEQSERSLDFDWDADAIFASFMAEYHIDLIAEKGKLSWFKFIALLNNLSSNSALSKIIQIRKNDGTEYANDAKALSALMDAKAYYQFPETEEERHERIQKQMAKFF